LLFVHDESAFDNCSVRFLLVFYVSNNRPFNLRWRAFYFATMRGLVRNADSFTALFDRMFSSGVSKLFRARAP